MFALLVVSCSAALLFIYLFMPALWLSLLSVDDSFDAHENGVTLVASRNPFRETGPPANMAKLILLRHKIQTSNKRRRSSSHSRQLSRTFNPNYLNANGNRPKAPWMRFGKAFGAKQYH